MPRSKGSAPSQPKGASKKAAKQYKAMASKPPSKRYGEPVMKKVSETRSVGYASVAPTSLPKYKKTSPLLKLGVNPLKIK